MKYELYMECRAGTRHAPRTQLIIVLPNGTFQLQRVCAQCKTQIPQTWNGRGAILKRNYKHSPEYRAFINDHDPAEARVAILGSDIRKVQAPRGGTNNPSVRQVPGAKAKRGRKPGSQQRPRDKRRA